MFKKAKYTGKGYMVPLEEPLKYTFKAICPYGLDKETNWKWSIKLELPMETHDEFITKLGSFQYQIIKYLEQEFPTTHENYFIMQPITANERDGTTFYFRAKIPLKYGIAQTWFTGNDTGETKRILTDEDIPTNTVVEVDVECDGWWILDKKKTVGQAWCIKHVRLIDIHKHMYQ